MSDAFDLETLWAMLLSRDAERIRAAWVTLAPAERAAVLEHLRRMTTESGWADAQRASAQTALDVLDAEPDEPPERR